MEEISYSFEELEKFKVEIKEIIDPDLLQEEREQYKLHLHQARLPLREPPSNEGEGLGGGAHTPTYTHAHIHT